MKLLFLLLACSRLCAQTDTTKGIILFPGIMTAGYLVGPKWTAPILDTWYCVMGDMEMWGGDKTMKVNWLPFSAGTVYDRNFNRVSATYVRAFYVPAKVKPKLGF